MNIVEVVLDDVGFGQLGCYGSSIATPSMDRLAADGLRFTNFHTTTICSSSRACFLTGRNHHAVGIGTITNFCTGEHPGYAGRLSREATTTAEVLREAGYATFALGKWHLGPHDAAAPGATETWPLARGFDRFYGFVRGATSQWVPDLIDGDQPVDPPRSPADGYHVSADLVDRAIEYIGGQVHAHRNQPFYMHLAFGCAHDPHHAPPSWIERYRGRFDHGWDVERARIFARQQSMGLVSADATLPPPNDGVPCWADLRDDERRVFARMHEVFAGFVAHTDDQFGRLLDALDGLGLRDDTVVMLMSDNGASGEGGRNGYPRVARSALPREAATRGDTDRILAGMVFDGDGYLALGADRFDECLAAIDELGAPGTDANYPQGWAMAGNTPFRRYKGTLHYGGVRCPLIVRWPGVVPDPGGVRHGFHHAIDIHPTVLDAGRTTSPPTYAGVPQRPVDGVSFRDAIETGAAPIDRVQYFEMLGHRGLYADGWKAVCFHRRGDDPADDVWELYDTTMDPTECDDRASSEPERLAALVSRWWEEAERNLVLPMNDFAALDLRFVRGAPRSVFEYHYGRRLGGSQRPTLDGVDFEIRAEVAVDDVDRDGVLVADGTRASHCVLWIAAGALHVELADAGGVRHMRTRGPVPRRVQALSVRVTRASPSSSAPPRIEMFADDVLLPTVEESATATAQDPASSSDKGASEPTLDLGADVVGRSDRYAAPFAFAGTLTRVQITTDDVVLRVEGPDGLDDALDDALRAD